MRPTAPSPTTATVFPGPASASEAASRAGISSGSGCPEGGDQGAVGQRDAGLLRLGADPRVDELGVHALGLEPGLADLAGVVGDDERADHEVPGLDGLHGRADLLDDADVLMSHEGVVGGLDTAVRPSPSSERARGRFVSPDMASASTVGRPADCANAKWPGLVLNRRRAHSVACGLRSPSVTNCRSRRLNVSTFPGAIYPLIPVRVRPAMR
jgi:hypothetical protein